MALPKQHRLGSNRDFSKVHRKGLRASTQHLAVRALSVSALSAKASNVKASSGGSKLKKHPPKLKLKKPSLEAAQSKIAQPKAAQPKAAQLKNSAGSADGKPFALSCAKNSALTLEGSDAERHAVKANISEISEGIPSKFGISISKKVSKRAVIRNRIKRQIKAILHRRLPEIAPGWKVVIVVRPSAVECEFDDFLRELEYLLRKLSITDT